MRIIHTADWHLGDKLGRLNRTRDLEERVERVAELCAEHKAELLLIAGDLFSEQAGLDEMTASLKHIRDTFAAFFAGGGTILAITGNHDRDNRIDIIRAGMQLAVPDGLREGCLPCGRMYLVNGRGTATLRSAKGQLVQFMLVPYPYACRYNISAKDYKTKEEENVLLRTEVTNWIVAASKELDQTLPTVMVAHLHVRGTEMHSLYKLTERDDILFNLADLNTAWQYVALGHIHKPQCLGGADHVRYPGSLDRLDFGDRHDDHGVLLLEIQGSASVRPERLRIPGTPFLTIDLNDPDAELDGLAEKYQDRATAIVRVNAKVNGGKSKDEVSRELKRIFPQLYDLRWTAPDAAADEKPAGKFDPHAGFESTVRAYLAEKLAADPEAADVIALAGTFLKNGGGA